MNKEALKALEELSWLGVPDGSEDLPTDSIKAIRHHPLLEKKLMIIKEALTTPTTVTTKRIKQVSVYHGRSLRSVLLMLNKDISKDPNVISIEMTITNTAGALNEYSFLVTKELPYEEV